MTPDRQQQWETQLDADLKALPEIAAPPQLARRVMEQIQRPGVANEKRRTWQDLPSVFRTMAVVAMTLCFGLLCLGAWVYSDNAGMVTICERMANWLHPVGVFWNVAQAIISALAATIRYVNPVLLVAWAAAAVLAYFLILATGTLVYKFAASKQ